MSDSAFKSGLAVMSGARNPEGVRLSRFYPFRHLYADPQGRHGQIRVNQPWYLVQYHGKKVGKVFTVADRWTWSHRDGYGTSLRYPSRYDAIDALIDVYLNTRRVPI